MFKKWKEKRERKRLLVEEEVVRAELEALHTKYNNRRHEVRPPEQFRPLEDFMTVKEQRHYFYIVYRHNGLTQTLFGEVSEFFDPKKQFYKSDAAPLAYLTVTRRENPVQKIKAPDTEPSRQTFIEQWTRDEEFEAGLRKWMEDNGKKFWQNMTPTEKYNSIKDWPK